MRSAVFVISLLALALATTDFFLQTLPLLRQQSEQWDSLDQTLQSNRDRVEARGAPPSDEQLAAMTDAMLQVRNNAREAHDQLFHAARDVSDYLVLPDSRPARMDVPTIREQLKDVLVTLPGELASYAGLRATRLGIRFPSATVPIATQRDELIDQVERCLVVQWTLDCLRSVDGLHLENMRLNRSEGFLQAELRVAGGVDEVLAFYERYLEATPSTPPRSLQRLALARRDPEQWTGSLSSFRSAPMELAMTMSIESPRWSEEPPSRGKVDGP